MILVLSLLLTLAHPAMGQTGGEPGMRPLSLEWEPIEGASAYELRFVPQGARLNSFPQPLNFRTPEPSWSGQLPPGHFVLQIRSLDQRGAPGRWDEGAELTVYLRAPKPLFPAADQSLTSRRAEQDRMEFKWSPVEGAQAYYLQVETQEGDPVSSQRVERPEARLNLPVGRAYRWRVAALWMEDEPGEAYAWSSFTLAGPKLATPRLRRPGTRYVDSLEWNEVNHATSYEVELFRRGERGRWEPVGSATQVSESLMEFDPQSPAGTYKLVVKAQAPFRETSDPAELEFPALQSPSREPAALAQLRMAESLDKQTNFYFIASYFLSQMNYASINHESGSAPNFDAIGGTGRLGLGYQPQSSVWGTFGILDLSGFNIASQNFTFASAELHGTWTHRRGANHIRLSSGLFTKELPHLVGSSQTGFSGLDKATSVGPHLGFDLWRALSPRLGVQVNGRIYSSVAGKGPNQEDLNPEMSMMFGLLGSYRLTPRVMGLAGYAYRLDRVTYPARPFDRNPLSLANPGDINSIEVQGHYLNLILEVDF